ncbi:hypothetical protein OOK36_03350 [Streptomyces sp. NBC_00365]|uniref:hypothetical protein n=1 Tax=Streptomyces sp. NBC_00365 TaxID=2975726 RepID=UPI0022553FEF|nr:hypothetical protein [Streptomyces sp. NBC_00365]MCX5087940.1 hypothetical protein [Streptomyces sp. NBC_00365]
MNRRTRMGMALASTFPTLLAVPVICLLAAVGAVPWTLLLALPVALVVHAASSFFLLKPRPSETGSGCTNTV